MFRKAVFVLAILLASVPIVAQQKGIIFNKTEHDFETIAPSSIPFEQDFLFRNTTDKTVTILSVRSVSPALSFINTRSEILPTEYGFVKVKLKTDGLNGLFHDEVYVTFRVGDDVKSEVIYLRAQISVDGKKENGRAFQDSDIAVSVEVSPEDIETMEGFTGNDRLTQAESEIAFLKKQVSMKSELIAKLSSDIREKHTQEVENIECLYALENTLQSTNTKLSPDVLKQISQLGIRLNELQASGQRIQSEIANQESEYQQVSDSLKYREQEVAKLKGDQDQLENQLENAKMSNELAFEEIKYEAIEIQRQKDSLVTITRSITNENRRLTNKFALEESQEMQAQLVVEELTIEKTSNIHFEVSVIRSKDELKSLPVNLGPKISVFRNTSGYEYTVGQFNSMKAALNKAEEMKGIGYNRSHVIAFKNGERISMQKALDTAEQK